MIKSSIDTKSDKNICLHLQVQPVTLAKPVQQAAMRVLPKLPCVKHRSVVSISLLYFF